MDILQILMQRSETKDNKVELLKVFKELKSDVDTYGTQLIHKASSLGNLIVLGFLINYCVCINVKDDNGFEPIHFAAREGLLPKSSNIGNTIKKYRIG